MMSKVASQLQPRCPYLPMFHPDSSAVDPGFAGGGADHGEHGAQACNRYHGAAPSGLQGQSPKDESFLSFSYERVAKS